MSNFNEEDWEWNPRLPTDATGWMRLWQEGDSKRTKPGDFVFHASTCGALKSHEMTNHLTLIPVPMEWLKARYENFGAKALCGTDVGECLVSKVGHR